MQLREDAELLVALHALKMGRLDAKMLERFRKTLRDVKKLD